MKARQAMLEQHFCRATVQTANNLKNVSFSVCPPLYIVKLLCSTQFLKCFEVYGFFVARKEFGFSWLNPLP